MNDITLRLLIADALHSNFYIGQHIVSNYKTAVDDIMEIIKDDRFDNTKGQDKKDSSDGDIQKARDDSY